MNCGTGKCFLFAFFWVWDSTSLKLLLQGDVFGFMKLCSLIITELKNLSAASRAGAAAMATAGMGSATPQAAAASAIDMGGSAPSGAIVPGALPVPPPGARHPGPGSLAPPGPPGVIGGPYGGQGSMGVGPGSSGRRAWASASLNEPVQSYSWWDHVAWMELVVCIVQNKQLTILTINSLLAL